MLWDIEGADISALRIRKGSLEEEVTFELRLGPGLTSISTGGEVRRPWAGETPSVCTEAMLWGAGVNGGHRVAVVTFGHLERPPQPQGQGVKPKLIYSGELAACKVLPTEGPRTAP